jgi:hypothetical protein
LEADLFLQKDVVRQNHFQISRIACAYFIESMAPNPIHPQIGTDIANLVDQCRLKVLACNDELRQAHEADFSSKKDRRETIRAIHHMRATALTELKIQRQNLSQAIAQSQDLPAVPSTTALQPHTQEDNLDETLRAIHSMIHSLNKWITHAHRFLAGYGHPDEEEEALRRETLKACIVNAQTDVVRWQQEWVQLQMRM